MKFTFITIVISLLFVFVFTTVSIANELDSFLDKYGVKVEEKTITDRIQYFLDPRYRKKEVYWYSGAIISSDGERFERLQLKFNTVSNTVYLNYENQIYYIPPHTLSGFIISEGTGKRHFQKGYSKTFVHAISGTFKADALTVMENISTFEQRGDFRVLSVSISSENPGHSESTIEFSTKNANMVTEFNDFLMLTEGAVTSEIVSILPEFDENTFLEVMVIGSKGRFLKLNYKDVSQSDNMTQIKQSDTNTYNTYSYYIGNENKEIVDIQLTRKSLKKAFGFIGVRMPGNMPSVKSEKQLTSWLKKVL